MKTKAEPETGSLGVCVAGNRGEHQGHGQESGSVSGAKTEVTTGVASNTK